MKKLIKKIFMSDDCPNCGNALIVRTDCREENDTESKQWFCDGDEVRCAANCGFISAVSADENGVWIQDGNIEELPIA